MRKIIRKANNKEEVGIMEVANINNMTSIKNNQDIAIKIILTNKIKEENIKIIIIKEITIITKRKMIYYTNMKTIKKINMLKVKINNTIKTKVSIEMIMISMNKIQEPPTPIMAIKMIIINKKKIITIIIMGTNMTIIQEKMTLIIVIHIKIDKNTNQEEIITKSFIIIIFFYNLI